MRLIVTLGGPRKNFDENAYGARFDKAVIQTLDWDKRKVLQEIAHEPPAGHLDEQISLQFKGGHFDGDDFWVVTNTEVLCYNRHSWAQTHRFTDKSFNDLHAVYVADGRVFVCNTGLEMIQELNLDGDIVNEQNLATTPTWERFDRATDYRKVPSTKPHEVHTNHIFQVNGELWATRSRTCDAVQLSDHSKQLTGIPFMCHDGFVRDDRIYFSTVNGHIAIFDRDSKELVHDVDVNLMDTRGMKIGWTRGLEIIGDQAFLGISKFRGSKFKEYTSWIVKGTQRSFPSSILQIDLTQKRIVDIYEIQNHPGAAVYSIIQHPDDA